MASGGVNRMRVWKGCGRQLALMQARDMHGRRIVLDGGGGGAGGRRLHATELNFKWSGFAGLLLHSSPGMDGRARGGWGN